MEGRVLLQRGSGSQQRGAGGGQQALSSHSPPGGSSRGAMWEVRLSLFPW